MPSTSEGKCDEEGRDMTEGREVLVMVAPNGARLSKADVPTLPFTPDELAAEAAASLRAGAAAMHLHVRDGAGRHSLDPAHYRAAMRAIEAATNSEMLIQATTEAAGRYEWREQIAAVRALKPPAISIALRELLPEEAEADEERRAEVAAFFRWLHEERLAPQLICYAPEEVGRVITLHENGFIPWPRPFFLFVLGKKPGEGSGGDADSASMVERLQAFVNAFRPLAGQGSWMVCAFGPHQLEVLERAVMMGGHVRVGFENGRDIAPGTPAVTNAGLVAALTQQLRGRGLAPMPPARARTLFDAITRP